MLLLWIKTQSFLILEKLMFYKMFSNSFFGQKMEKVEKKIKLYFFIPWKW